MLKMKTFLYGGSTPVPLHAPQASTVFILKSLRTPLHASSNVILTKSIIFENWGKYIYEPAASCAASKP